MATKKGIMVKSGAHQQQDSLIDGGGTPPYRTKYRWVMLALVWLLYGVFGIVMRSISPLITPILKDLHISYSLMGLILGSWPLAYILVALVGGTLIDRWGIRKSLLVGIVIIALSASLRYFANGFATMFLFVALFGLGGPMVSIGCPKTVAEWFRGKDRGTAVGIYMTGLWLGGLVAYSITNSVVMPLTGYSWRLTFVVYGLLGFIAALLWWFLARDIKTTGATESTGIVKVFSELIRVRNVQLLLIMGFLSFAISHGFNDWLPKLLEVGGLPPAIAGFAASIPLVVGIPSVLTIPRLTSPYLRGRVVALMSFGTAIALLIIAGASGVSLVAGLVVYGIVDCSIMPLLMLVLMDTPEVGSKYMGSAGGMFFCVAEIGGFAGPFLVGALRDLTGGSMVGASLLAGLAVTMAIMALFLRTRLASDTKAAV
ncbi:MAG: MFS transporter [Chloroflexi bacterium]|nr:MFS transporter [Chloroflexota bacterium]